MAARLLLPAALAALAPTAAFAQDGRLDVADGGDTAWLLAASVLALLVLPGVALLYAAQVRAKNVLSILIQCGAIFAAASTLWVMVGYTLAFGDLAGGWLGKGNAWMLIALGNVRAGTAVPESTYALFQMVFAALAPTLIVGACAERARFGWVVAFAALWSLVVYAPVAHWVWGGGWLAQGVGTLDWAGGIVVDVTAGASALVVAVMLGRRKGVVQGLTAPHAPALAIAGAALLWVGWLALSGGSAVAANDDAAAAIIAMHVGTAAAAMAWLLVERLTIGKPTAIGFASGAVAGMATLAPAAGFVSPGAAMLMGVLGGVTCHFAMRLVRRKLLIDDALGVFAVQGVGGIVGSLLLAVFLSEGLGGVGYGEDMNPVAQLAAQGIGVLVVAVWSIVGTVILALMASLAFPMRVSEDAEREGLDSATHGERAWNFD
ncbi:Ammonium transporter [Novosphingobium resinovorum]|uniref:Ammonium transporter n=1 Tax=Novosphingobium resinovorum TaxID=158500 RepID=A0A031K6I5_9SPHN|nr:ammonium transporter [Novosphingobium resinovorum]EZP84835.1 Ammonium transporter [Novosphingobium resinovorum]